MTLVTRSKPLIRLGTRVIDFAVLCLLAIITKIIRCQKITFIMHVFDVLQQVSSLSFYATHCSLSIIP